MLELDQADFELSSFASLAVHPSPNSPHNQPPHDRPTRPVQPVQRAQAHDPRLQRARHLVAAQLREDRLTGVAGAPSEERVGRAG